MNSIIVRLTDLKQNNNNIIKEAIKNYKSKLNNLKRIYNKIIELKNSLIN
jgi:hypothetical protein